MSLLRLASCSWNYGFHRPSLDHDNLHGRGAILGLKANAFSSLRADAGSALLECPRLVSPTLHQLNRRFLRPEDAGPLDHGMICAVSPTSADQEQCCDDSGAAPSFTFFQHPGSLAKVHLQLLAWRTLHPSKRQRGLGLVTQRKASHCKVAALKPVFADQVLVNPLHAHPITPSVSPCTMMICRNGSHRLGGPWLALDPVCGVGDFAGAVSSEPVCGVGGFGLTPAKYLRTVTRSTPKSSAMPRLGLPP